MEEINGNYRMIRPAIFSDDCLTVVLNGLKSQHSKDSYHKNAKLFNQWLVEENRAITIDSVTAYIAYLESQNAKPATINNRLATIRAIVKVAKRKKLIASDEAEGIMEIKGRKTQANENAVWLEKEEIQQLLSKLSAGGTNKDKRDACLLALGVATGLRRDELLNLTWNQVQSGRKTFLTNVKTKGSKKRKIIVQRWAIKYLDEWGEVTGRVGSLFVGFMSRKGERFTDKPINRVAFSKIVTRLGKLINRKLAPHDLRRTHAAMMYDAGKTIREIQHSLGHASIMTTEKYLKPIEIDRLADDNAFTI